MNEKALSLLPHGPEFRFLDRVTELEPGHHGRAKYKIRGDEPFLRGHFPGEPIFPGVLLVEAAAQLVGVVAQSDPAIPPLAGNGGTGVVGASASARMPCPGRAQPPGRTDRDDPGGSRRERHRSGIEGISAGNITGVASSARVALCAVINCECAGKNFPRRMAFEIVDRINAKGRRLAQRGTK